MLLLLGLLVKANICNKSELSAPSINYIPELLAGNSNLDKSFTKRLRFDATSHRSRYDYFDLR